MIAVIAAAVISLSEIPTEVDLPRELASRRVELQLQLTGTHFVARSTSDARQLLLFGSRDGELVTRVVLPPHAQVVYPFSRGAADEVLVEVVSLRPGEWRNTGALQVADVRDSQGGSLWVELAGRYAIGWMETAAGLVHAKPVGGLAPPPLLQTASNDMFDYSTRSIPLAPSTHVPAPVPDDDRGGDGSKPPVIEDKPLPPV